MNQTITPVRAGRDLDAAIAERVMGWKRVQAPKWDYHGPLPEQGEVLVPPDLISAINSGEYVWPPSGAIPFDFFVSQRYSTDIAAAWQVVEEITKIERTARLENTRFAYWWDRAHLWADTAEEAATEICRAALAAVEGNQPGGENNGSES